MSVTNNKLTASLEDYLEAVAMLKEQGGLITVTALSEFMGVKKPSVIWALRKLVNAGLAVHERYSDISLTPEGAKAAAAVYRRHRALFSFLKDILKVDPIIAEQDACKMEHALSRDSISRLEKFIEFVMEKYHGETVWEGVFYRFLEQHADVAPAKSSKRSRK